MFTIFRDFRRLIAAVERLVAVLLELVEAQRAAGPALDRLENLELSRFQFEAETKGLLLQAEGKLKAASNAEARERQLKRSYEKLADEYNVDGPGSEASEGRPLLVNDAEASEAERLQALHLDVAPTDKKADALRFKFGA